MREFRWIPGQGMDPAALARLSDRFRRPEQPMGEAWFMGEHRTMFEELLGDLREVPAGDIQRALREIASGTSSFGPRDEWTDWYHYLLGQLAGRCHDGDLLDSYLETLICGHMAVYPNGVFTAPYKTFREDALMTLGRAMMEPQCWEGDQVALGQMLHRDNRNPSGVWGWWDASGDFSGALFFCLKYLPRDLVSGWLRSVLAIPSPHWRAQVMVWAIGAHSILVGKMKWPSELKVAGKPCMVWGSCWSLRPELALTDESDAPRMTHFLPVDAREDAMRVLHAHFTDDVFREWLESILSIDYLKEELAGVPEAFEALYVSKPNPLQPPRIILG